MAGPTGTRFLLTGVAGFIGMHVARSLIAEGHEVHGVDSVNDYYDPELKRARLAEIANLPRYSFIETDLSDKAKTAELFETVRPARVVHLAAQAGVRYSLENPHAYADSNVLGFLNILEGCRTSAVEHLVYASSSSVYGDRNTVPYSTEDRADHPVSLYAATKRANELMAYSYSHLFRFPTTGLRFFTVYGPWGRPDMAVYLFTKAIFEGKPVKLFNNGDTWRDYTFIDDIVEGVKRVALSDPKFDRSDDGHVPAKVYNIGNSNPEKLLDLVGTLEEVIGKKAVREMHPAQPGDVYRTFADISDLQRDFGFAPSTSLREGLERFVAWYRKYHGIV
ncbi:NAD-dependent epimerase/dehydratase family protein [Oricola cellulosilytica]|uniref:NAD-dependent epimerase/dehydratase family protein n=1 Tax=Oricola cellulosilytica TaxID=1429082 RepID=A0A4R0P6A5_9HYPH|nr:NAD-dependent epimerase/dehydratase family protein [Oricola cellulosilytica]TCD12424.1 NAD-dependent epimerase/dehydratase family protein [Oricola cellulosilytica]